MAEGPSFFRHAARATRRKGEAGTSTGITGRALQSVPARR